MAASPDGDDRQQQQQPSTDPATTPLKIKLSSPTLAINTPILCHGYGNQEGVFCWYRSSPTNPFHLITTTLQPSFTPSIDDANNTITCQFKPDNGVPSEYAKIGPLRLPPELAHAVIRLMQNKNFINYPVTYLNTKGIESIETMQRWIALMTEIQELESAKQQQTVATDARLTAQWSQQQHQPDQKKEQPSSSPSSSSSSDGTTPQLVLETEQLALSKLKYDPQLDQSLALVHQELHSLIVADSFNPIVRACPIQNAMESRNIRHLQDYTLTVNSESLELVFTPPEDPFAGDAGEQQQEKKAKRLKKITSPANAIPGVPEGDDDDDDGDSEDEDHSIITHHKNRSSMGDLLSFLSTGVGNPNPDAIPTPSKLGGIVSDDEDEGEIGLGVQVATTTTATAKPAELAPPPALTTHTEPVPVKVATPELKPAAEPKSTQSPLKDKEQPSNSHNKTISPRNQTLLWNSTKMPNIPLSSALIFTPRQDVAIPLDKNIKLTPHNLPAAQQTTATSNTTTTTDRESQSNHDDELTYPLSQLLLIMDIRTSFIYAFHFDSAVVRDQYGLALRAMSEKLHSKRPIPTMSHGSGGNNQSGSNPITPNPLQTTINTSAAMTSVIPPAPVFKSWLPLELQQRYRITAPNGLTSVSPPPPSASFLLTQPSSPRLFSGITPGGATLSKQTNYFNDLEPVALFDTIAQSTWFNQLYPHYVPPSSSSSSTSTSPGLNQIAAASPLSGATKSTPNNSSGSGPSPNASPDNILPDVALLFKVYQHDQDTLIASLQDKIQYLYQRNLHHKKQSQLLTKQQHLASLELEIYKEKYHNERAYNDELIHSYYEGTASSVMDSINGTTQPILSRQLFRNQQHQAMVKTTSMLSDTRGFDLTSHHTAGSKGGDLVTPQKLKPSSQQQQQQQQQKTQLYDPKMSNLTKEMLQASQSTPALTKGELSSDLGELQDKVMHQQQVIQQLKRDNKQLIATNMSYKEQASLADEYEQEIVQQKTLIKQLQSKVGKTTSSDGPLISSPSVLNASSPAITTLQTTIVELTQQTQTQQQDIALKERKLSNYETQISKLTQQLHLSYQQQQDLITKGIKVEQDKLRQQFNSTERELNDASNSLDLLRNENNLYKTQNSLMESLNIQQHVEIETLETTIETLQTSVVGLINENEYLKKQQQAFITLQQQFKQQQAQLLLLQHENVTLSNTIQEHQQHIVNLQQQKQLMRNQSILGAGSGGNGAGSGAGGNNGAGGLMPGAQPGTQTLANGMVLSVTSPQDAEKMSNMVSELQYYKQKCFSLSTSMERLMRKHHHEMVQSNQRTPITSPNQKGKNGTTAQSASTAAVAAAVSGANTALIDPLHDNSDQELLYKIYTQQAHTMSHEQLCKEYKIMIKQLELLIETNKLLRFDIKQVKLQHDALQQQYNERIKYAPTPGSHPHQAVTIQTLQRDLLEKQLSETKHLVTTLTFVLQDKQQHIDLIKNTNKQLVIELEEIKKQIHGLHLHQQEQQHLSALQQVAHGNINALGSADEMNGSPLNLGFGQTGVNSAANNGQTFYF